MPEIELEQVENLTVKEVLELLGSRDPNEPFKFVPYHRFSEVTKARREAETKIEELQKTHSKEFKEAEKGWQTQLSELQGKVASADTMAQQLAELQAKEQHWSLERSIMGAGITDPEGIEFARLAYERLPPEGRAPVSEWLSARDALPRAVQAYMPGEPAAAPAGANRTPPAANAGARAPPAPSAPASAADIARMSPQEYAAQREAIHAAVGLRSPAPKGS